MQNIEIHTDISKRLEEIFSYFKISKARFSAEIGLNNNATISRIVSGQVKPSFDIITKILLRYPEINANWLLAGEGEMISETTTKNNNQMTNEDYIKSLERTIAILERQLDYFTKENQKLTDEFITREKDKKAKTGAA